MIVVMRMDEGYILARVACMSGVSRGKKAGCEGWGCIDLYL